MLKHLVLCLTLVPTLVLAAFTPATTVLMDHRDIELKANGGFTRTNEWMIRIDTQQGIDQSGQATLHFDGKRAKQTVIEAYTIKPNGEKVAVSTDRIKIRNEAADELSPYFSDEMTTVIIFPQVEVGSKLYYKVVTQQDEPTIKGNYSVSYYFSPHFRYEDTRIRLTHPPELPVYTDSRNIPGATSTLPDGRIRYEYKFTQDKAYPPEPNRVELSDFAPGVQFSTYPSYAAFAATFQNLMQPKTRVTPQVQNLADKLTAGTTTPKEKAQKLYNWVSTNIRYVGIDIGASGFEPHTADEILANKYGDCKDHTVLLESLLLAVGIQSTPALINISEAYELPKLASTDFDHVITYVPSLDVYLDSTAQFAEFGTLPGDDQGKPTLLTQNGETSRTPYSSSKRDYTVTRTKLKLMPDGRIIGSSVFEPHGSFTYVSRTKQFSYENRDNQTIINNILGRFQESGTGEIVHADPTDLAKTWVVKSKFELDPVINLPGPSAFTIPYGLVPGYIKALSKERPFANRRYPFVCGSARHLEHIEITIPKNIQITKIPSKAQGIMYGQTYISSYKQTGNIIDVTREYSEEIGRDSCTPKQEPAEPRRQMLGLMKTDLRSQIFVQ